MIKIIADPYLAKNAGRRYPLSDDTEGIADNAILDIRITTDISGTNNPVLPYITGVSSVTRDAHNYKRISVVLKCGGKTEDIINFDVPKDIAEDGYHEITAVSSLSYGSMYVTAAIISEPDDTTGKITNIPVTPYTVVCRSLGVDSIQGIGATDLPSSTVLTGDVVLDPGRNTDPYLDGQNIRLSISKGAGIGERCQEAASGQTCDNVLFTINGERPSSNGAIQIRGDGGISVTPLPEEHAIMISVDSVASEKMTTECEKTC